MRLVVSTAVRARSAVAVSPAAIAIRAVLDCTATALSPWPTRSWRSRAIRSRSSTVARRPASSTRERSLRTSTPSRATTAVTAADEHEASRPWVHELGGDEDRDRRQP